MREMEHEMLGGVPIYRYDPAATEAETEDLLAEGRRFCFRNSDGEIVATGIIGPRMKTVDDDGDLWSISLLDVRAPEEGA